MNNNSDDSITKTVKYERTAEGERLFRDVRPKYAFSMVDGESRDASGKWTAGGNVNKSVSLVTEGRGTKLLFHGTSKESPSIHIGQTFADDAGTANRYGNNKNLLSGKVSFEGLKIAHVSGYNRDSDDAIGDSQEDINQLQKQGIDVIIYQDEDPQGRPHTAYRIISPQALGRVDSGVRWTHSDGDEWEDPEVLPISKSGE